MVRAEIFKAFGYFVTELSRHMSEYVPYFRKRPELIEKYLLGDVGRFTPDGRARERIEQDEEIKRQIGSDGKIPVHHSGEYGSIIIHSIETGKLARINGNVNNKGLITNLPEGCCVEVPCLVDKGGDSSLLYRRFAASVSCIKSDGDKCTRAGSEGNC